MGTAMAPSYVNIFIDNTEAYILRTYPRQRCFMNDRNREPTGVIYCCIKQRLSQIIFQNLLPNQITFQTS